MRTTPNLVRTRRPQFENFRLQSHGVTRPERSWPAKFVDRETNRAILKPHRTCREKVHRDRGRMPAARCQTTEEARIGRCAIEVECLHVILTRKLQDRFFRNMIPLRLHTLADLQIFERKTVH
ncbi:MAG: hypothetical protein M3505_02820 [Verrucomicrobiota bacterium]|nr:hypothetical protein [Verrucomicrobiota bacterium]